MDATQAAEKAAAKPAKPAFLNANHEATVAWLACQTDDERRACVKKYPQLAQLHSGASNFTQ